MEKLQEYILNNQFDRVESLIKDVELPAVAIPSYLNRKNNNIKALVESLPNNEFMIFVYEDDLDNYQEYTNYSNVRIIPVSLSQIEYRGITPKRKFIIDYLIANNYSKVIMLDDDISTLFNRTTRQENKKTGKKTSIDIWTSFKLLIKLLDNVDYGIGGFYMDDFINFWDRKKVIKQYTRITNAILINLDNFKKYDINYDPNFKTGEDCDIVYQLYLNNINSYCLPFIAKTFTIKSGGKDSVSGSIEEWRRDWVKLFVKWKGFLDLKNFPNSEKFKYKEVHRKIYKNDQSFIDNDHKARYDLAKSYQNS